MFTIVVLSSAALPGTNGFVGEFLILSGAFRTSSWWAALAVGGVVLSVVYLLWAYQQVMHGPVTAKHPERLVELTRSEMLVFVPLIAMIFAIGLYPRALLDKSEATVKAALTRIEQAVAAPGAAARLSATLVADLALVAPELIVFGTALLILMIGSVAAAQPPGLACRRKPGGCGMGRLVGRGACPTALASRACTCATRSRARARRWRWPWSGSGFWLRPNTSAGRVWSEGSTTCWC